MPVYTPPPMPIIVYVAQTYNCDTYGAANYNDCPTDTPESGASPNQTARENPSNTDTPATTTDPITATEETPPSSRPATTGNPITDTIADSSWGVLIPISIIVGVLIALIILLIKRLRRKKQDTLGPPPIQPNGPSNPFSTGQ